MTDSRKWLTQDERVLLGVPPTLSQLGDVRGLVKKCVRRGWLGYPPSVRLDAQGNVVREQQDLNEQQTTESK